MPLHRGCIWEPEQAVELLLGAGPRADAKDMDGDSPLSRGSWHLRPNAILRQLTCAGGSIRPERALSYDHGIGWGVMVGPLSEVAPMGKVMTKPSAVIPIAMSVLALAVVIGYAVVFGTARQADEGTAAHLWQLLMAGQTPVVLYFAVRWLPMAPREGFATLSVQFAAAAAAMLPVWWFRW